MMRCLAIVAALAASACSQSKQQPAAPSQPTSLCPKVADHLVSLMSGAEKHPPEATDPLRRVIHRRCDEDRWSEQTQHCLLQLDSLADGARCQAGMTDEQIAAFQRDSEAAMIELRGQFADEPPTEPPQNAAPSDTP